MRLRRADLHVPVDLDRVLLDQHPATLQVDVPEPDAGDLTPTQSGVRGKPNDIGIAGRRRQALHLLVAEIRLRLLGLLRRLHVTGRVRRDPPIAHRAVEDGCQHSVAPLDRGRRLGRGELGDPCGDLGVPNRADSSGAPSRLDVDPPRALVRVIRRGLYGGLVRDEPILAERRDRGMRIARRDVRAGRLRHLDLGDVRLGVALAEEAALACRLAIGLPVPRLPALASLRVVRVRGAHTDSLPWASDVGANVSVSRRKCKCCDLASKQTKNTPLTP